MIETYETLCFSNEARWIDIPEREIGFFQWEDAPPYRPRSSFKMCFVREKGIFVRMKTDETRIRAVCKGRDENCWEDSCMEFFFKPFSNRNEYLNFEITAKGAYLSAFGKERDGRRFLKSLTEKEPVIKPEVHLNGWKLELFVPCSLIEDVYGQEFAASPGEYRGNFFKCGDKTQTAHYGSFSPMGKLLPGFHNPKLFAKIIVKDVL